MEGSEYGKTAFPESEGYLKEALKDSSVNAQSFQKPMKRCTDCKGMCCYHGAHVNDEEAAFIQRVADQERSYFEGLGLNLPEKVIVEGEWRGEPSGKKTALKQWDYRERLPQFPKHWDNTACVFLTHEGFCGLQIYSKACGLHPWWAKPLICWIHPVNFPEDGTIAVYDKESDPTVFEDYPGFNVVTECGACHVEGDPAYEILEDELAFLGDIVGRDFNHEIRLELESEK